MSKNTVGSDLVAALERSFDKIIADHPEVPHVVIVINSGGNVKYGHFAHSRWNVEGGKMPEIMISAEALRLGGRQILGTLLHEAAHGLCWARNQKRKEQGLPELPDVSGASGYHNKRFAQHAEELGLIVRVHPDHKSLGHTDTTLPEGERDEDVAELTEKLTAYREFDEDNRKPNSKRSRARFSLKCLCSPPRSLHMTQSVWEKGDVLCGICGEAFGPDFRAQDTKDGEEDVDQ